MGNCFNRQGDSFVKHQEIESPVGGAKLNALIVMAEEEKKSYSGHAGLPHLVSLAEEESKNIKSPERSPVSPAQHYEQILSTPSESPETTTKSKLKDPEETHDKTMNSSAFNPEESNILHQGDDKNRLVMIDEFSEEEIHDEEDANNNFHVQKNNFPFNGEEVGVNTENEKLAPLATAD